MNILQSVQEESQTAADCPSPGNQDGFSCPPGNQNDPQVLSSGHKTDEEESDSSEDIVPILVRPGHIRFGRAGNSSAHKEWNNIDNTLVL
jgi:coilin